MRYLKSRLIRLYPIVVFGSVIGLIASILAGTLPGSRSELTLLGALLIPTSQKMMFPLDPPLWSLLFEMIASILFGLGVWNRWGLKLLIFSVALSAIGLMAALFHQGNLDAGWALASFHYGLVRVGFGFGCGVLLHRLHRQGMIGPAVPSWAIATALLASLLAPSPPVIQAIIVLVIFPALLILGARDHGAPSLLVRWSGALSYPLYAVHYPILVLFVALASNMTGAILFGPVALGAAFVVLKVYDEPVRARLWALGSSKAG